MTTIPIEVIVQDAESPVDPTPTPVDPTDQGENTNIIVPDTGVGTIDNNSGASGSSATISIVSIIIAVLAIGAVIALLVRKSYKRKTSEAGMTRREKRAMAATSTIAVLALTVLLGQLVVAGVVNPMATNAATDNETDHIDVADKISIVVERTEDSEETITKVTNTSYVTSAADFGYKVTASMEADATTANLYLDGDETSEYYIAPVEDGTLSNNTWGYTLAETSEDYLPIPLATNPTTIVKGYNNIEDESVDIYYTIQVDKDLPAGTYIGELEYNIDPAIEYMQDLATLTSEEKSTLLTNMTQDEQYILKDNRDEKPYYISKLADGNIWMTQNLDLDLNSQVTLTSENTNISANWTPANSTIVFTGTSVSGWTNSTTIPYSADPGDIYYYTSGTDADDIKYDSLEECEAEHSDGTCQHYHAGNYYNWSAAVASNDTSEMTEQYQDAPGSICPSGWRLPEGPSPEEPYYHDLSNLAISYPTVITELTRGCGGGCLIHKYLPNGFNTIRTVPLWYVRSGVIGEAGQPEGSVRSTGYSGYYWSNTAIDNYAVRLYFNNTEVRPDDRYGRVQGYSVRCVAR